MTQKRGKIGMVGILGILLRECELRNCFLYIKGLKPYQPYQPYQL